LEGEKKRGMEVNIPDTLNAGWKNNKKGFGYKMLYKMGWKDDKGLGKEEDGITEAVKVRRRDEGVGVGTKDEDIKNHAWAATTSSFNDVLDTLKMAYGADRKNRKNGKKKKKRDKETKPKTALATVSVGVK
jgi:Pin2-interacting protein X1